MSLFDSVKTFGEAALQSVREEIEALKEGDGDENDNVTGNSNETVRIQSQQFQIQQQQQFQQRQQNGIIASPGLPNQIAQQQANQQNHDLSDISRNLGLPSYGKPQPDSSPYKVGLGGAGQLTVTNVNSLVASGNPLAALKTVKQEQQQQQQAAQYQIQYQQQTDITNSKTNTPRNPNPLLTQQANGVPVTPTKSNADSNTVSMSTPQIATATPNIQNTNQQQVVQQGSQVPQPQQPQVPQASQQTQVPQAVVTQTNSAPSQPQPQQAAVAPTNSAPVGSVTGAAQQQTEVIPYPQAEIQNPNQNQAQQSSQIQQTQSQQKQIQPQAQQSSVISNSITTTQNTNSITQQQQQTTTVTTNALDLSAPLAPLPPLPAMPPLPAGMSDNLNMKDLPKDIQDHYDSPQKNQDTSPHKGQKGQQWLQSQQSQRKNKNNNNPLMGNSNSNPNQPGPGPPPNQNQGNNINNQQQSQSQSDTTNSNSNSWWGQSLLASALTAQATEGSFLQAAINTAGSTAVIAGEAVSEFAANAEKSMQAAAAQSQQGQGQPQTVEDILANIRMDDHASITSPENLQIYLQILVSMTLLPEGHRTSLLEVLTASDPQMVDVKREALQYLLIYMTKLNRKNKKTQRELKNLSEDFLTVQELLQSTQKEVSYEQEKRQRLEKELKESQRVDGARIEGEVIRLQTELQEKEEHHNQSLSLLQRTFEELQDEHNKTLKKLREVRSQQQSNSGVAGNLSHSLGTSSNQLSSQPSTPLSGTGAGNSNTNLSNNYAPTLREILQGNTNSNTGVTNNLDVHSASHSSANSEAGNEGQAASETEQSSIIKKQAKQIKQLEKQVASLYRDIDKLVKDKEDHFLERENYVDRRMVIHMTSQLRSEPNPKMKDQILNQMIEVLCVDESWKKMMPERPGQGRNLNKSKNGKKGISDALIDFVDAEIDANDDSPDRNKKSPKENVVMAQNTQSANANLNESSENPNPNNSDNHTVNRSNSNTVTGTDNSVPNNSSDFQQPATTSLQLGVSTPMTGQPPPPPTQSTIIRH